MLRQQQLGAFSSVSENLLDWHLDKFAAAGGRYVCSLLDQLSRPDSDSVLHNRAVFAEKKRKCSERGIAYGGWFNGWGDDPEVDAQLVAKWVREYGARPVILDLEIAYMNDPEKMPALCKAVRALLPTTSLFVSVPGLNDSMIWNGRISGVPRASWKSMLDLSIRVMPQWYSAYADGTAPGIHRPNEWADPVYNMTWLKQFGMLDNFEDLDAPGRRAVPLSYVKGTVEVTGLEGSSLAHSLGRMRKCWDMGLLRSPGMSIYLLENTPYEDFALLAAERGRLFLA